MSKKPTKKPRIQAGPMLRTRSTQKQYDEYRRRIKINDDCVFCNTAEMKNPIKKGHFTILGNRFGYEIWDGCKVADHLMVIPTRHVGSIKELTPDEKIEYVNLLGAYESKGYSVYSRSVDGPTRSIFHLHTHLIKLDSKPIKRLIYLEKPHLLLYKK